jgi:hypothetical protein
MVSRPYIQDFSQCLTVNGDGTGSKDMAQDFSGGAQDFFIKNHAGIEDLSLFHATVTILFPGKIEFDKYGNLDALTNGIKVSITDQDDDEIESLAGGGVIKDITDWFLHAPQETVLDSIANKTLIVLRWDFREHGSPIRLREGWSLRLTLNDNFSGLDRHVACIKGCHLVRP